MPVAFLAQAGHKGPATVEARLTLTSWPKQLGSKACFKGFLWGPLGPLLTFSFMDPPMLFIMVSVLIKVLPFSNAVLAKWQHP